MLSDVEDAAGCHNNTVLIYTNGVIGDLIDSISIVEILNQFWVS